jgi:hypothetical protein
MICPAFASLGCIWHHFAEVGMIVKASKKKIPNSFRVGWVGSIEIQIMLACERHSVF